jgi:hypothetical protein
MFQMTYAADCDAKLLCGWYKTPSAHVSLRRGSFRSLEV